jgi:hypothetical protein
MYKLEESTRKDKKWKVTTPNGKIINFGAKGYEDYTIHKDDNRRDNYISRHKTRENWTETGIETAGWWSYWLLWNEKTLDKAIEAIEDIFGIEIEFN